MPFIPEEFAHEVVQAVQQHVPGVKQIQDITQQEQFFQLIVADVSVKPYCDCRVGKRSGNNKIGRAHV